MCSPCPKLRIAVIFVKTQTSVRSAIRTWDLSRRRQACYHVDHCDLQDVLHIRNEVGQSTKTMNEVDIKLLDDHDDPAIIAIFL